jgi:hypothetical protein
LLEGTVTDRRYATLLIASALLVLCSFAAAGDVLTPEPGEKLLSAEEVAKVLAELPALKSTACLKARIVTEVDDLVGKRQEEGELLLDRPTRVLRKFTKPSFKLWLLDGAQLQEYAPANKVLYIKDFTHAPRKLRLVQAAFTGDVRVLQELFAVSVFRKGGDSKDQPASYRFVLTKKPGADNPLDYKSIQAKATEQGLFFSEIEFVPGDGDRTVERYTDIAVVPKPADKDFAESLGLPAGVTKKIMPIDDTDAGAKKR